MNEFPRTQIENISLSRLIVGTNWFLGYSHTSEAKDKLIKATMDRKAMADILEVFLAAGVDAVYGVQAQAPQLNQAVEDAEQRVGRKFVRIAIPRPRVSGTQADHDENCRLFDAHAAIGADICMPHQAATDALLDRTTRTIRGMDSLLAMIRQRGMAPGLSTHMPETPIYADATGLDAATYIQIYNAAGFLMQVEIDWVHRIIWKAAKPVITIKPLAAGRLLPLVGLGFSWATLRDRDMVAVGVYTPDEAREVIDISLSILHRRPSEVPLQTTRSKQSVTADQ